MVAFSRGKRETTEIRKRKEKGKESEGRAIDIGAHRVGMQRRRKQVSIFLFLSRLPSVSPRLQLHVLYSRVSMVFSLWYLLFRCPCPCLGTPSGSVSTRNLPLPLPFSHRPSLSRSLLFSLSLRRSAYTTLSTTYSPNDAATCVHTDGTSCISTSALEGAARGDEGDERLSRDQNADGELTERREGCYCKATMTQQLSDKRETFKTILCFTFVRL